MTLEIILALALALALLALAALAAAHRRLRAELATAHADLERTRQKAPSTAAPPPPAEPSLPPAQPQRSPISSPPAPAPTEAARPRILVVDDDPTGRELSVAVLQRVGYHVDAAGDGLTAVAAARSVRYDLILLDVEMPGLDGPAAARQIRSETGAKSPVIVALTAHVEPEEQQRCRDAGVDDILFKPIEIEHLRAAVARHLPAVTAPTIDRAVLRQLEDPPGEFVTHLLRTYLQEAAQDAEALRTAHAAGDAGQVARLAHRLKGSSAGVGAKALAARCQALYAAARAGNSIEAEHAAVQQALVTARAALLVAYPDNGRP